MCLHIIQYKKLYLTTASKCIHGRRWQCRYHSAAWNSKSRNLKTCRPPQTKIQLSIEQLSDQRQSKTRGTNNSALGKHDSVGNSPSSSKAMPELPLIISWSKVHTIGRYSSSAWRTHAHKEKLQQVANVQPCEHDMNHTLQRSNNRNYNGTTAKAHLTNSFIANVIGNDAIKVRLLVNTLHGVIFNWFQKLSVGSIGVTSKLGFSLNSMKMRLKW